MEEARYAYFLCTAGLVVVKISNIEHQPIYKCEFVSSDESKKLPYGMGLFSHSNIIYLVGGEYNTLLFMFDHNKFDKNTLMFSHSIEKLPANSEPMFAPSMIAARDKTYFFSDSDLVCDDLNLLVEASMEKVFDFQSFDATKKCFVKLPSPPFKGRDEGYGHFLLGSCIHLFVLDPRYTLHAFTFDTMSLEWMENELLASYFNRKKIHAPINHRGDVGLSDEVFFDNTQIMVALSYDKPTAYRVEVAKMTWGSLCQVGNFEPMSYRTLDESYMTDTAIKRSNGYAQLAYFGGGRFCVVHGGIGTPYLLIYVFRINFALEHEIQISDALTRTSSIILSSKRFKFTEDLPDLPSVPYLRSDVCFLSDHHELVPTTSKGQERDDNEGCRGTLLDQGYLFHGTKIKRSV